MARTGRLAMTNHHCALRKCGLLTVVGVVLFADGACASVARLPATLSARRSLVGAKVLCKFFDWIEVAIVVADRYSYISHTLPLDNVHWFIYEKYENR